MSMLVDDLTSGRPEVRRQLLHVLNRPDPDVDPEAAAEYDRAAYEADALAQAGGHGAMEMPDNANPYMVGSE